MKKGINLRRRSALTRLEAAYKAFVAAGEDKPARTSTRTNKYGLVVTIEHPAVPFKAECARMEKEIKKLKETIQ